MLSLSTIQGLYFRGILPPPVERNSASNVRLSLNINSCNVYRIMFLMNRRKLSDFGVTKCTRHSNALRSANPGHFSGSHEFERTNAARGDYIIKIITCSGIFYVINFKENTDSKKFLSIGLYSSYTSQHRHSH